MLDDGLQFPMGGGATGALILSTDWSTTALGPVAQWPDCLKTTIATMLHSRHPMFLWWGPELIQFYNDASIPNFGAGKHPMAMGQPGRDCWGEIWTIIGPQIEAVMSRGDSTWHQNALVPTHRNGRLEEVHWNYGYSPVFDATGAVGGTLVVCTEITSHIIEARRQQLLRTLAERTALAFDPSTAFEITIAVLREAAIDVPFAAIFDGMAHKILSTTTLPVETVAGFTSMIRQGTAATGQTTSLDGPRVAAGPWPEPVTEALIVPVDHSHIVFGLSPRLPFDGAYRHFLGHVAGHLTLTCARAETLATRVRVEAERRDLLLQAPVATAILTGPLHVFEVANSLYLQTVGREVVGGSFPDVFPELAGSGLFEILDRVYETGVPFVTSELPVALRDHTGHLTDYVFRFNLQPIYDASCAVCGMMVMAIDITEIVRSRQQQVEVHAQLLRAHEERASLLDKLESAGRAKDEFLAMLGHELRNPLAPITTALALVKQNGNGRLSCELQVIERQVNHLTRLVDDLLDVSKITRGKVELKRELIELGDVLTRAVETAACLLEQRRHRLTIDVPREGTPWWGDPVRLSQIVANLLTNAARYTEPGGEITLSAKRDAQEIVIRVTDNGTGISPDLLPLIFDVFIQGKQSRDRAEGGLGIGLSLVKNLVGLHGGTVSAHSEGIGKGSEFVVRLPAWVPETVTCRKPKTKRAAVTGPKRRVMVVDDNVDAADMLAEMLRSAGHELAVAYDGIAALELFSRFRPEIAIVDIGLPVMDGYQLAGRLHDDVVRTQCRLVALTGYGTDDDRARSAAAGFAVHLVKPVNLPTVLGVIADSSPDGHRVS